MPSLHVRFWRPDSFSSQHADGIAFQCVDLRHITLAGHDRLWKFSIFGEGPFVKVNLLSRGEVVGSEIKDAGAIQFCRTTVKLTSGDSRCVDSVQLRSWPNNRFLQQSSFGPVTLQPHDSVTIDLTTQFS